MSLDPTIYQLKKKKKKTVMLMVAISCKTMIQNIYQTMLFMLLKVVSWNVQSQENAFYP